MNQQLISIITEWIKNDNNIKKLQAEVKLKRQRKKELTNNLVNIMKQNEIDCFNTKNEKLTYKQNIIRAPLSKKHLIKSLEKFFEDDVDLVQELSKFILNTRKQMTIDNINRKNI